MVFFHIKVHLISVIDNTIQYKNHKDVKLCIMADETVDVSGVGSVGLPGSTGTPGVPGETGIRGSTGATGILGITGGDRNNRESRTKCPRIRKSARNSATIPWATSNVKI